ncbi:putative ribonuclease H-like domain-containing protein [Tanacetum coccineum]|uniref:Ribonuclease H-like domain-containing protein n=1 Tax=Tanacetum coccineum TaxID=301880 RepID=A0ABQ5CZT2_9ASTR
MACGKDFSNPFMVDNLPKIVGFSTHLASLVKSWLVQDQTVLALASPKQTATEIYLIRDSQKSSTISKAEEFVTELQNLKTQEKEAYSTNISEDTPEILAFRRELDDLAQKHLREVPKNKATSTNSVNSSSGQDNTQPADQDDSNMPKLTIFNKPQKGIFDEASYDDEGMVHDFNNLPIEVAVSPIPTLRIFNIHPQSQILGDPKSYVQTRSRVQQHSEAHALVSYVQKQHRNNHKDQQHCLFACFLSQEEPKKISEALQDDSWVEAIQEENKRDERGVVVRNKARLVAQDEEVYVYQPPGFIDPDHPKKVDKVVKALYGLHQAPRACTKALKEVNTGGLGFSTGSGPVSSARGQREGKESSNELLKRLKLPKEIKKQLQQEEASPYRIHKIANVVKALYGLHQAPRAWYATLSTFLEKHGYRRGTIDKTLFIKKDKKDIMLLSIVSMGELIFFLGLQVKQKTDGIFISQDKYVADMLKKFDLASVKTAITLNGVTPKTSHLNAVKRIFKYLKGKPNLGLWYPKRIHLLTWKPYSDSDYAGTEAEYVAACNLLWTSVVDSKSNADYGFNFMNTKIYIDNESTICIVKNPVYHSKTKHIEIRHHFIRDSYEKKLIRVEKIHTDFNVADLLTKAYC